MKEIAPQAALQHIYARAGRVAQDQHQTRLREHQRWGGPKK